MYLRFHQCLIEDEITYKLGVRERERESERDKGSMRNVKQYVRTCTHILKLWMGNDIIST